MNYNTNMHIQFYKKPAGSETPSDLNELELLDEF